MTDSYFGSLVLYSVPGQLIQIGTCQFELVEPPALRAKDGTLFPLSTSGSTAILPNITIALGTRQEPGRIPVAIRAPTTTIIRASTKGAAQ